MSRTFEASGGTAFIHNGDYSGTVDIVASRGALARVPFEDIKEFIADYVRHELICFAENAEADQILHHAITRIRT